MAAGSDEIKAIEKDFHAVRQQFRLVMMVALALLIGGAVIYKHLLHLTWVNAFYFCTVTLTTVGYGDITPNTNTSKIFTIFYILIGIGILATFANLLIKSSVLRRELKKARRTPKSNSTK